MSQISLIIPLYNAVKYLRPCLDSIVEQTFGDFEVILVDDGSTDETVNIAAEYMEKYPNFKLISQSNCGVSSARNYGVETSSSPYIAFLDQDDVIHPQALETLYYLINTYQVDVSMFDVEVVPENFVLTPSKHLIPKDLKTTFIGEPVDYFFSHKKGRSIHIWNKLYKREIFNQIEFPLDVQPAEDTVFTLKVFFTAKSMVKADAKLIYYRKSSTSVMRRGITEKYIRSHAKAAEELVAYFKTKKLEPKHLKRINFYMTRFIFKSLVSQPLRLIEGQKRELLELSLKFVNGFFEEGCFDPKLLGFRKSVACRLFLIKKYQWAKMFL